MCLLIKFWQVSEYGFFVHVFLRTQIFAHADNSNKLQQRQHEILLRVRGPGGPLHRVAITSYAIIN